MNFSVCKAAEGSVAVATLTDNNVADGNSDKSLVELWACQYTNMPGSKQLTYYPLLLWIY